MKRWYNCRKLILWDRTFVGTHKTLAYWNNRENLWKYHLTDAKCCMVHLLLLLPAFLHPVLGTFLTLALCVWVPTLLVRLGLCSLGGNLEVCSGTNICPYCSVSIKKKKKKSPKSWSLFSAIAMNRRLWSLWQKPLSEESIVGNDFSIVVWLWVQIFMAILTIEFKTQDKAVWHLMVARKKSNWTAQFAAAGGSCSREGMWGNSKSLGETSFFLLLKAKFSCLVSSSSPWAGGRKLSVLPLWGCAGWDTEGGSWGTAVGVMVEVLLGEAFQGHTVQDIKKSSNTIAYLLPLHILNFAFLLLTQFICPRHTECLVILDVFAAALSLWFCLVRFISFTSIMSSDGTGLNHCICKGSQLIPMSALHKLTWFQGENVFSFNYIVVFSCSPSYFNLWADERHGFGCSSATCPSSSSTGRKEASWQESRSLRQTHQSLAQSGHAAANSNFLLSVLIYWICWGLTLLLHGVPSFHLLSPLCWMGFSGPLLLGVSLLRLASAVASLWGLYSIIQVSSMLWVVAGGQWRFWSPF